jgi:hypothetical protein
MELGPTIIRLVAACLLLAMGRMEYPHLWKPTILPNAGSSLLAAAVRKVGLIPLLLTVWHYCKGHVD